MLRVTGVTQGQLAQGLARTFAHQPGGGDKALQRPLVTVEHFNAGVQTGEGSLMGQAVKLTFMGVDPTHEPVPWIVCHRSVIAMKIAVQRQFIATGESPAEQATKIRMRLQIVVLVKVRHHQPSHRHTAERVDGFDKWLVIDPGLRRDIVQHQ
ncbi:hypothetical protein D3C86_1237940 [compost metagenome]